MIKITTILQFQLEKQKFSVKFLQSIYILRFGSLYWLTSTDSNMSTLELVSMHP